MVMTRDSAAALDAIAKVDPPRKVPNSTISRGLRIFAIAPSIKSSCSGIAHL